VTDKEAFVDVTLIGPMSRIAVAKANRQIMFYDIRTFKRKGLIISATKIASAIPMMDRESSEKSIVGSHYRNVPLFNVPSAILAHPDLPILYVGDCEGRVEVFEFFTDHDGAWDWRRVTVDRLQHDAITQIMWLADSQAFLSSSMDGSFLLWRYDIGVNKFTRLYRFANGAGLGILSFAYDSRTKDVPYITNAHYVGMWRMNTQHYEHIQTDRLTTVIAAVPLTPDASFCITISETNFATIYHLETGLELISHYYMGLQHEFCPPTGSLVLDTTLYLVGVFLSKWQCEDGSNDGLTAHAAPVIAAATNDVFHRIISLDREGGFIGWEIATGTRSFSVTVTDPPVTPRCMRMDSMGRRLLIGQSDGTVQIVSANSGTELGTIDAQFHPGGCNFAAFETVLKSKRILTAAGAKLVMFEDITGNRTSFIRNFLGHTEEIARAVVLKGRFILTIGAGKELFMWNVSQQHPVMKFQVERDPTFAVDIPEDPKEFILGDIDGRIIYMSMDSPTPLSSFLGIEMTISCAVTTIFLNPEMLIVGNMNGYVKIWARVNDKLEDIRRFRAHTEGVISLAHSAAHSVLVTAGLDEEIRIWSLEPFGMIGELGKIWKWKLDDQTTWRPSAAPSDDPRHFAVPEAAEARADEQAPAATEGLEAQQERVDEGFHLPPFSFDTFRHGMDLLEDLWFSGQAIEQLANRQPSKSRKTPRASVKPLLPSMDRELNRPRTSSPKVWRPRV
jgi:WD40 repeat protein